jgi:hypothetical protein
MTTNVLIEQQLPQRVPGARSLRQDMSMYSRIRVEKRHPDGSPRAVWEAYRIDDSERVVRLWAPPRTPRTHVRGHRRRR